MNKFLSYWTFKKYWTNEKHVPFIVTIGTIHTFLVSGNVWKVWKIWIIEFTSTKRTAVLKMIENNNNNDDDVSYAKYLKPVKNWDTSIFSERLFYRWWRKKRGFGQLLFQLIEKFHSLISLDDFFRKISDEWMFEHFNIKSFITCSPLTVFS